MDIKYYVYHFAHLHTAKLKGKPAPHKAVLLLAVMSLIERGSISTPEIELTDELVDEFKRIWAEKLPSTCPFSCDISKPYFHMQHEPFWRLIEHDENYWMVAEELGLYAEEKKTMAKGYTIPAMREKFRCAKIDGELYNIIRCADNRKELENLLISKYLTYEPPLDKRHGIAAMVGTALLMVA